MSLGILIGTERGLYGFFPGERPHPLLPDIPVTGVDAHEGVAVIASPGNGVWLHDGGPPSDWRQVWEGDARSARITPEGDLMVGTAPPKLLRSRDGGETWEPSTTLESVVRYKRTRSTVVVSNAEWALTSIAFPPDGILVGVHGAGVWLSMDEGRGWMPRSEGIDPAVTGLYEHPEHKDRVYATTRSGLFRSDDGGYTWLQSLTGLDRSIAQSVSVMPESVDTLIMSAARRRSGQGALFRSIDGGVRWMRIPVGDEDEWPVAPIVTRMAGSLDTTFVLAGERLWASHNRGISWLPLTGDGDTDSLPPASSLAVSL